MIDGPNPTAPTIAERAFLRTLQGWGATPDYRFWDAFSPSWRERLSLAWLAGAMADARAARDEVGREHRAQVHPDLDRVHPSWLVRALADERPSIRRAVVKSLPLGLREALQPELKLEEDDPRPAHSVDPDARRWALALWADRLVGDVPERDDDPPVIVALTGFDSSVLVRLVQMAGLAKWVLARDEPPPLKERDRSRFDQLRRRLGTSEPGLKSMAEADLAAAGLKTDPQSLVRLGLMTLARLLAIAEPYRVRWALQHVPYSMANALRSLMGSKEPRGAALIDIEAGVLRAAWEQLREEGQIGPDGRSQA